MKIKLRLDYSTVACYRSCPTKFRYLYFERHKPDVPNDATEFGSCIHEALEVWHTTGEAAATIKKFEEVAESTCLKEILPENMRSIEHGRILLSRYFEQYGVYDDAFRIEPKDGTYLTELSLEMPLLPWLTFTARIDGIGRHRHTNDLMVVEHKTSYVLGDQFLNRMEPNDQITGYVAMARYHGFDLWHAIVNGLQTARKKIETKPTECFSRHTTYRNPEQIDDWRQAFISTACDIARDIERGWFNRNMPDACVAWNKHCPYHAICNAPKEDRDRMLQAMCIENDWPMSSVEVKE